MLKYLFKGTFDKTFAVARAALFHFNQLGILMGSPDGVQEGCVGLTQVEVITANKTLTPAENGKIVLINSTTSKTVTLPPASKGKMRFKVILRDVTSSGGHQVLGGSAADKIIGFTLTGTAGQDLTCPAASDAVGDGVELVSDGVDTWHIVDLAGTWTVG